MICFGAGPLGFCCVSRRSSPSPQQPSPEQVFAEAVRLHNSGQYAEAVKAYEAFLAVEPEALEAISNLGVVYARLGNYGKAIELYQRALKLAEDPGIRFNLGLAHYQTDQFGNAALELDRVLKQSPSNVRAAVLLADCRLREDNYKAVIALLDPFLASAPDNRALPCYTFSAPR